MKKLVVDQEKCLGCGTCAALAPGVFELKEGKAKVKKEEVKEEELEGAIEACPVGAISWEEK